MKDRVPTYPGRILLTPVPNQQNKFDITMMDEPSEAGTPLNKSTLLANKAAAAVWRGSGEPADPTPSLALERLGAAIWRPVAEFRTAGTYSFTVPDLFDGANYLLGVLLLGGGGSGSAVTSGYNQTGAASGVLIQRVLKVGVDISIGSAVTVTVGAGGAAVSATDDGSDYNGKEGKNGGTSSFGALVSAAGGGGGIATTSGYFAAETPSGGQCPTRGRDTNFAPFGGVTVTTVNQKEYYPLSPVCINLFDPTDVHVYCGAGGMPGQPTIDRASGHAGAGKNGTSGSGDSGNPLVAGSATAPGDGGGSSYNGRTGETATSGAGADGLCLIYARMQ